MPNENKPCCSKCNFKKIANDSPDFVSFGGEYCGDTNCPCHQEDKFAPLPRNEKLEEMRRDVSTPSQEENHSIHCECLKCFTEEPPKPKWEEVDKKFTDQFWASTQGRNDIRNEQIKKLLANKIEIEKVVEVIRQVYYDHNPARPRASDLISSLKQKLLAKKQ